MLGGQKSNPSLLLTAKKSEVVGSQQPCVSGSLTVCPPRPASAHCLDLGRVLVHSLRGPATDFPQAAAVQLPSRPRSAKAENKSTEDDDAAQGCRQRNVAQLGILSQLGEKVSP